MGALNSCVRRETGFELNGELNEIKEEDLKKEHERRQILEQCIKRRGLEKKMDKGKYLK